MNRIISLIYLIIVIFGAILAKGFWSTLFVFLSGGLWGLYLTIEHFARIYNLL